MMFNGKVALVTGASRGIGRSIAQTLATRGADVALIGRDVEALRETAELCANARAGATAEVFQTDVADRDAVERATGAVIERFSRIDFAISNAGQSVDALLLRLKSETIDRMLDVNLKSAFYLCAAVAKP
ncbi:MAG: SDR family NAD(P)-dependent oxidoreductase, partial [Candidatus Eremiobacteraeota bacterium]|nr:SDR family NAD(P)-dependent oxidoreductase [Candidatus Eremiobacteraeota bacterium]